MKKWINTLFKRYLEIRRGKIDYYKKEPKLVQQRLLERLIVHGSETEFGLRYDFKNIHSSKSFSKKIPVQNYEYFEPFINRMMHGEPDVLWPGQIKWFAKSSGTTSHKNKFIPVTPENLKECHIKSSWDAVALLYDRCPDLQVFAEKNLIMGGSLGTFEPFPATNYGDVSAIMTYHMPLVGRPFYTPDFETALLPDWNEKIERMAQICAQDPVTMFGGVPTWTIVLFKRMLEMHNAENMLEIWPNVKAYMHGGVGFEPYRKQFEAFLPKKEFTYHEIYNASEGFFATQDREEKDMLLLLDNGVYFEFLPPSEWHSQKPIAIPIWEVEEGISYGLVISTNSGLWRYIPGDTVAFTSIRPYRIIIKGRMKQFINAFGEEVVVANTDQAIANVCQQMDVVIRDYSVAPVYMAQNKKGRHQWVIEFEKAPMNDNLFATQLDLELQSLNGDYEAKRAFNLALEQLEVIVAPDGTFEEWLKSKGKIGAQHKVPRLSNDREIIEEVLQIITNTYVDK